MFGNGSAQLKTAWKPSEAVATTAFFHPLRFSRAGTSLPMGPASKPALARIFSRPTPRALREWPCTVHSTVWGPSAFRSA